VAKMKKILIYLLILVLSVSFVTAWSGLGTGTVNDPYQVSNCTLLQEMNSSLGLFKYYELTNNIDCNNTKFISIGYGSNLGTSFTGSFNGNYYTISNLYLNESNHIIKSTWVALFGSINNAIIENLNMKNIVVNSTAYSGALIGDSRNTIYLININIDSVLYGGSNAGGLGGRFYDYVYLYNVSTNTTQYLTSNSEHLGGITGYTGTLYCKYCSSNYNLYSNNYTIYSVGGLFGDIGSINYTILNSYSNINFYNISSASYEIGGLLGTTYVHGSEGDGIINNTYTTGSINPQTIFNNNGYIGGLVGGLNSFDDDKTIVDNSYSSVFINNTTSQYINCDFGGDFNSPDFNSTVTNMFLNSNYCNDTLNGTDSIILSDNEMKQTESFVGFNFTNDWIMVEDYTYPELLYFWENGSVIVYKFYDMVTGLPINNTNMTIITDGTNIYHEDNTINESEFVVWNLPADEYSLSVIAEGYEYSQFNVELGEKDIIYLNMYLLDTESSGGATAFRIRDKNTGNPIYQANVDVYRKILLGLTWTKVASYKSDIIGKVQFSYLPYKSYRFVVHKSGYIDQDFVINPITQTLYTINMEQDGTLPVSSIVVTPENKNLYNGMVQNYSVLFYSSNGSFTNYSVNVTYPGGNVSATGTQPYGSTLTVSLNITGASLYDMVYIDLTYTANGKTFTNKIAQYVVISPGEYTISKNKTEFYGLGVFERTLISTMIILLVAGIGMISIGTLASGSLGLLLTGYLSFIGFLPVMIAIPLIIGFIIISWRSSQ
jgi:hypothetical protein